VSSPPLRLEARQVSVHFDGIKAVDEVDLDLVQGEILGLIGPNGAGKTTLVNAISGFQRPNAGGVRLGGDITTRWSPARLANHGLTRTFQAVRLFPSMTVRENVEVAALVSSKRSAIAARRADELLGLFGLAAVAEAPASSLPYGDERRLGIARALATSPRLLLLDEPAAGLNEQESDGLLDVLALIRSDMGCGLLVIEHDMRLVMRLCDRLQVLDDGRTIFVGNPTEAQRDAAVLEAYLGPTWTERSAQRP
jgi:ABC-type branched-subunit amino acid transport system ATPase component